MTDGNDLYIENILDQTIVCVTGYVDNESKKNHVLELLSSLKEEELNVCYLTHSPQYLSEISSLVDYVYYDSNNMIIDRTDFTNNADLFDEKSYDNGFMCHTEYQSFGVFKNNFIANHCPAVLILFKNLINFSRINNFTWVVLLDYDLVNPNVGFKKYIIEKLNFLVKNSKTCFTYIRPDNDFIFPCVTIFKLDELNLNDILFKENWDRSVRDWISCWKLGFSETIIQKFLQRSYANKLHIENIVDDSKKYWGVDDYISTTKFSFAHSDYQVIKITPAIVNDKYILILYLQNMSQYSLMIHELSIINSSTNKVIYTVTNKHCDPNTWHLYTLDTSLYNLHDTLILNYEIRYNSEKTKIGKEIYNLNYIDNIYNHLMSIKFNNS